MTSGEKIIFLEGGSFNPPTSLHLRILEIARDYFEGRNGCEVIGGVMSPVHDAYGKPGLLPAEHRRNMVKISLETSDWIRLSEWESMDRTEWTPTRISLQYHENYIKSVLEDDSKSIPNWMPPNIRDFKGSKIHVKLLCGADLLESFAKPGLWSQEDLQCILGKHGIVVITRSGSSPEKFILESDLLCGFRKNIYIVENLVRNEISSSQIRHHLDRSLSVKYLLNDYVVEYIRRNKLYGVDSG